jgi:hypothetical protein
VLLAWQLAVCSSGSELALYPSIHVTVAVELKLMLEEGKTESAKLSASVEESHV